MAARYRRYKRQYGRIWLLVELVIVLGGGIAIAWIAGDMLRSDRGASPARNETTETITPSAITSTFEATASLTMTPSPSTTITPMLTATGTASPSATATTPSPDQTATPASSSTSTPTPTVDLAALCAEPNDDFEEAFGPLGCPGLYSCLVWPEDDQGDFYFFRVDTPSELILSLRNIPDGADWDLYLFNEDGEEIAFSDNSGTADEEIVYEAEPGLYYINVGVVEGASETQPYFLELRCTPLATPASPEMRACQEPNGGFDTAYGPIACEQLYSCRLSPGGGDMADVYYIDIYAPQILIIDLTDIPPGSDWSLHLYSFEEESIARSNEPGNANEQIVYTASPGRYYIAVQAADPTIPAGGYSLYVTCLNEGEPTPVATRTPAATSAPRTATVPRTPATSGPCAEPNEDFGQAYGPLVCGQSYACEMDPPGGDLVDMYYIDISSEVQLTVYLTDMPEDVDWDLSLYSADGYFLAFSGGVLNEDELIVYFVTPGRYYIAVEVIEDGLPAGGYVLRAECNPIPTPTSPPTWTPTKTATATRTPTWTRTATRTRTPTKTRTFTPTRTPSPTRTLTETRTPTVTRTATVTATPTETWTPTISVTATGTPSSTSTPTMGPSATSTATSTHTPTGTNSPTLTLTWTPTHTGTPTSTLLATSTPTGTVAISSVVIGNWAGETAESGEAVVSRWNLLSRWGVRLLSAPRAVFSRRRWFEGTQP